MSKFFVCSVNHTEFVKFLKPPLMLVFVTRYYPECGTADICRCFAKNFAEVKEYVRKCKTPSVDIWNVRITDSMTAGVILEIKDEQINKMVK